VKKIKIIAAAAFGLFVVIAYAGSKEYTADFMRIAPKIDGNVNDSAWLNLKWTNDFRKFRQCTPAVRKTRFKVGYAYDGLCIAVECYEPEMNKILAVRKDMKELWLDDSIEIFVTESELKYRHFIVNAAGARGNEIVDKGKYAGANSLWKWQAKTQRKLNSWTAEILIPYCYLNFVPNSKLKIGFNVCRTATPVNEISSWAPQRISFHDVGYFGSLRFGGKLSKQELDKLAQSRILQCVAVESAVLDSNWNKFKQEIYGGDDLYAAFARAHKDKVTKLDKMIKGLKKLSEAKYNAAKKNFEELKKELVMFDRMTGRRIVKTLINIKEIEQ
jgi:hypothetical protein